MYSRDYFFLFLLKSQIVSDAFQRSLSDQSQPDSPSNGVSSLSLTVPVADEPLSSRNEEVKQSDSDSGIFSPPGPSGLLLSISFH